MKYVIYKYYILYIYYHFKYIHIYVCIYIHTHVHIHAHITVQQRRKFWEADVERKGGKKGLTLAFLTEHIRTSVRLSYHPFLCSSFLLSFSCLIPLVSFFTKRRSVGLIRMLYVCVRL